MVERMRAALRAALPPGAFLKRERGEALFVTDAPRRGPCPDWGALGFSCEVSHGLARLTPGKVWVMELEAQYPEPPDHLCQTLRRGGEIDGEVLRLFSMGLKRLDGEARYSDYGKRLRQLAAARLREHGSMGGLYACGIINCLTERKERG